MRGLPEAAWVRSRAVAVTAFALLVAVFVIDVVTSQTLVVAILLDVPIVLAALTRSRRLTATLVIAALAADAVAGFINAAHDGYRWEPISIGDRVLSMLSIVLVGYLSTEVQERAERVGRMAAQERLLAELAERNDALSERQDVIRDLVYALSHDLRTPLAALSMTLRQASDGTFGDLPERYAGVLRESLVSIDDLRRLSETLLLVARIESGDRQPEREPVDLAAVVNDIAVELQALAESRGLTLVAAAGTVPPVLAARGDLKRAISNLVANALQHTPQGGTVRVSVGAAGDRVEVTVTDDGYGIDARMRSALFERFSTASRAGGGTGLGLYIVRRIAEESGGSVRYAPREPRGSAFTLALPEART